MNTPKTRVRRRPGSDQPESTPTPSGPEASAAPAAPVAPAEPAEPAEASGSPEPSEPAAPAKKRRRRGGRGRGGKKPAGPNTGFVPEAPRKTEPLNTFDASGDFAAMLDEAGGFQVADVRPGDRVEATLIHIGDETAVFELGAGSDAVLPTKELPEDAAVGDTLNLTVLRVDDSVLLSKGSAADPAFLDEAQEAGLPVEGKVTGVNKGGLEITLTGGMRGFCPISQADLNYVEEPSSFMGRSLTFLIQSRKGREVVLSRRALLERERREQAEALKADLHVGAVLDGEVRKVEPFGAFVELGGLDGLLPTSEIGWGVKDPTEALSVGDRVRVEVIRVEPDEKRKDRLRITLSRRALERDPLDARKGELAAGSVVEGKVSRLETFGAFVELGDGLEGLIHISEMAAERVRQPSDVVNVGDPVTVRVLGVDPERRRISLSLRDPSETQRRQANLKEGEKVTGVVSRHERYGVFVELKEHEGVRALVPAAETGTERGTDLRRAFPIGSEMSLAVLEVDDRGRVRASVLARARAEEREVIAAHTPKETGSLGTFGDLFKNALKED
jgi:small subunit ribosomal protein S1